ncbi:MAG: hypothetical protein ACJAQT_005065 [Akkermansiaceae bacterium]|jgi:hypothetical protein
MAEVTIVVLAAEATGDLLEGSDILAGLAAIDHGAFGGISDSHDEGSGDGGRHFGHAGGGDGVAIADEEEGGGVGRPVAGDFGGFFEAIEEAGFADGENGGEGEAI